MSLDNPFNDNNDPWRYGASQQGGNSNWRPPPVSGITPQDNTNDTSWWGANPSTDMVGQSNLDGYAANPNSYYGGWSPPSNVQPNTFGTNLFNGTQPYAANGSTASSVVQAAINGYGAGNTNPTGAAMGTSQGAGPPTYTPPTTATGGASGGTAAGGTTAAGGSSGGTTNPNLVGGGTTAGTGGTGTAGSTAATPGGLSYGQMALWDPTSFQTGWTQELINHGYNPTSMTPAARFAYADQDRAMANWMGGVATGRYQGNNTQAAIDDWINTGGHTGVDQSAVQAAFQRAIQGQQNGTLSATDPMAGILEMMDSSPSFAQRMVTAMLPRTLGSQYLQNYVRAQAQQNQLNGGNPIGYTQALLRSLGVQV